MRPAKTVICLWLLAVVPALAQKAVDRVMAEARKPSTLEANLERLTDQVGGRVPGTPAMEKAVQWGIEAFRAAGADNAHAEEFTIQHSWAEGATTMTVVEPETFPVRAISKAWAPALAPAHHVAIVDVGRGSAEDFAKAKDLTGSVLLVHSEPMRNWDDLGNEYTNARLVVDRAVKAQALAVAFQSTRPNDLLYRHTNSVEGEIDRLPQVLVAREDASRMARLLASGQKLYVDLSIPNQVGGPISSANVVAELPGREHPEEFVVLGAHLDSWDLGTGALDDGCNAALVVDTFRAIKNSGVRPRRSIRFILFSGEEEGMIGSYLYVRQHRHEMDKAVAVVIFDSGIGRLTGFSLEGRKDLVAPATHLLTPLTPFSRIKFTLDASADTDDFDFMLEGVPTFVAGNEEDNYLINYHASSDTFDKVDFAKLKQHVVEAAAVAFAMADAPGRVGPRLTHAQIEQNMRAAHLDVDMQTSSLWQEWETSQRGREK